MIRFTNAEIILGRKASATVITEGLSLTLAKGDFTCILGPSGSGKTTLLNVIADLQPLSSGSVFIDGLSVTESQHSVGYVFQGHNIFPWKTVRQNIAFGLTFVKTDDIDKNGRVEVIAAEVGLSDYLDNYPDTLSGGMKQRVGLARALVGNPSVILMDEPFASLDALTAIKLRKLLMRLSKKHKSTIVFVTHNIDEAIELGDRVLVVSRSPMRILIDKRISNSLRSDGRSVVLIKTMIFDALKLDMDD